MLATLRSLRIRKDLLDNMIVVGNKMDLVAQSEWKRRFAGAPFMPISATEGLGLDVLVKKLERRIFAATGRRSMVFRVRPGSHEHRWMNEQLAVTSEEADAEDDNYVRLRAVVSDEELGRFKKQCGLRK